MKRIAPPIFWKLIIKLDIQFNLLINKIFAGSFHRL